MENFYCEKVQIETLTKTMYDNKPSRGHKNAV